MFLGVGWSSPRGESGAYRKPSLSWPSSSGEVDGAPEFKFQNTFFAASPSTPLLAPCRLHNNKEGIHAIQVGVTKDQRAQAQLEKSSIGRSAMRWPRRTILVLALASVAALVPTRPIPSPRSMQCRGTYLDDFLLGRNVTVRQTATSMLPIQTIHGASFALRRGDDDTASSTDQLSHSSRYLMGQKEGMTVDERRRLRLKIAAEARASRPLDPHEHLRILYVDQHICVVNKPSGILSVPGPRRNPSIANLVYDLLDPPIDIDQMVVHRLDMDTSGILVFALDAQSLSTLHEAFRFRRVQKSYEALLVGHWTGAASEVEIDVGIERDHRYPPFMRIAMPRELARLDQQARPVAPGFQKFIDQAPKPSLTDMRVKSLEYIGDDLPVTRVRLQPHTGRTHQLRVHAASLRFPIVGDDIYGYLGEGDCGVSLIDEPEDEVLHRKILDLGTGLCLHAQELRLLHPHSQAPMIFKCNAPF